MSAVWKIFYGRCPLRFFGDFVAKSKKLTSEEEKKKKQYYSGKEKNAKDVKK
jgi:hypothetical protein